MTSNGKTVGIALGTGLLAGALGVFAWLGRDAAQVPPTPPILSAADMARTLAQEPPAAGDPSPSTLAALAAQVPVASVTNPVAIMAGDEPSEMLMFRVDAQGRLVVDETTRLDIEKLFALNEPAERLRKQRALEGGLPPEAARELSALMARYDNYQEAQFQQLPPGQELRTRTEAMGQFERLTALRVQYFGAPMAEQLFGHEEAQQRELLASLPIEPN